MRDFIVILPVLMFMFLLFRSPAFRDDKTGDYYKREVSGKTFPRVPGRQDRRLLQTRGFRQNGNQRRPIGQNLHRSPRPPGIRRLGKDSLTNGGDFSRRFLLR